MTLAKVVLDFKTNHSFDYSIPDDLKDFISIGSFVEVPLGSSIRKGTVISINEDKATFPLKPIYKILKDQPLISPDLLKLAFWMEDYYCTPLSSILKIILPITVRGKTKHKEQFIVKRAKTREEIREAIPHLRNSFQSQAEVLDYLLKIQKEIFLSELIAETKVSRSSIQTLAKKGFIYIEKTKIDRSPLINEEYFPSKPKILNDEQKKALENISEQLTSNSYGTHLLHGITGSGKTEIYLQAIAQALLLKKSVIMLVPEIALTSQTIERFRSRFEGHIAVLHHRLSDGEKHDEWQRIYKGEAKIVIGARSAIFSPVMNLGLIIIDEEHESSFKNSEQMPSYHAREVGIMRAHICKATVILGSATPSIESLYNCDLGKFKKSLLQIRPDQAHIPEIKLVDMRPEYEKKKGFTIFSESLLSAIEKRIKLGEQTILFLNRRGYHTMLMCKSCGLSVKCPHCEISLTFHKNSHTLSCHLCDYSIIPPTQCPSCKADAPLKFKGIGTEQVESALYAIFPEVRLIRLDADTTKHKGSHQKLYKSFRSGKADILIGTQMIAKGLHFPEVTLVGVLNSDLSLNIPDFRASETTYQLLTQVAGRAGRGVTPGEVLIQTCIPENSLLQLAVKQDFNTFYKEELKIRELFKNPPFTQLVKLRFSGNNLNETIQVAENFRSELLKNIPCQFEITPIDACGYPKIKDTFRIQFLIKGPKISTITHLIKQINQNLSLKKINLFIDINPLSTFF